VARWVAAFAGLMAAPMVLIWSLASAPNAEGVRGLGDWPYLTALGTAVLVASALTIVWRVRAGRPQRTSSPPGSAREKGVVSGVVVLKGNPVTNAKITALRAAVETAGAPDGTFALESLGVGRHVLEITGSGRRVLRRIDVQAQQTTHVEIDLDAWSRVTPRSEG
jgi:Carboxypeptidase regulatory-like domain